MFVDAITSRIEKSFGTACTVHVHGITRNNLSGEQAMTILEKGSNLSPAILLRPFYHKYLEGTPLGEIEEEIREEYRSAHIGKKMDVDFLKDWNAVKDHIVCRVIGARNNREMLENIPCEKVLDLAVVYYYQMVMPKELQASMLICREYLPLWGVSEEELKELAAQNTKRLLPAQFLPMRDILTDVLGEIPKEEGNDLYVLTNEKKLFGAYWITQEDALEKIRSVLGEDYLLLPSSVHEAIILPKHMEPEIDKVAEMVACINRTEVAREDVLTNSVYGYRQGRGLLLEAAASEPA